MSVRIRLSPYGRLCLSLGVLIVVGWVVLMMPGMGAAGRKPITCLDGLFTSTSSVCVTGLIVRSTGNDFSPAGQLVILVLIQIGGLGFMTLSSSMLMYLRQKATIGQVAVIRESLGSDVRQDLPRLLVRCLRIVVIVEATGAALLFGRFCLNVPEGTAWYAHLPTAAWQAIFHSVSAFCNAGFSIWDTSLAAYVNDWWVNMVFVLLIVLGGLGFFVLADVERWLRSLRSATRTKLRFQSHVVLFATFLLIAGGAILIWLGERSNMDSLGRKSLAAQGMVSVFHSVTARTAGFNTVRISEFSHFSVAVLIILMFIGASPGSCGGGVKTTTFAVLMTLALGAFRPRRDPSFRNRTFSPVVVRSAIALFFAAGAIVLFGALFLMGVETGGQAMKDSRIPFVPLLFEAVSAFGTVGLTTGITPTLSAAAKLCLVALMFLGRVGPLGLISATLRGGARPVIRYPYEDVQIG